MKLAVPSAVRFCGKKSTLSMAETSPIGLTAPPSATTPSRSSSPQGPKRYGVFFAHPRETFDFHYERRLFKVVGNTLADPSKPPSSAKTAADRRVPSESLPVVRGRLV